MAVVPWNRLAYSCSCRISWKLPFLGQKQKVHWKMIVEAGYGSVSISFVVKREMSYLVIMLNCCSTQKEEEAQKREQERLRAEGQAKQDQERRRAAQELTEDSQRQESSTAPSPSAPAEPISDFPVLPTAPSAPPAEDVASWADTAPGTDSPAEGNQREPCTPAPPTYSSLFSVLNGYVWARVIDTNSMVIILCDVIFLVRLQGKFDIDHSWEWGGGWFLQTTY